MTITITRPRPRPGQTFTTKLLWTALVGSMLAVPLTLSASIQPEGRRGFRGDRGRGGRAIFRELDLTEEQREQMHALRKGQQGQQQGTSRDIFERLTERRNALSEAVISGADEATLRQLAYECGEAEGDAAVERARMHGQMMAILTEEQQEQYLTLKEERKQKKEARLKRMQERRENRHDRNPDSF